MAQAVKQLWPKIKLGIGPSIEDGFYYDFDREEPFTEAELSLIENKMKEIIKNDEPFISEIDHFPLSKRWPFMLEINFSRLEDDS